MSTRDRYIQEYNQSKQNSGGAFVDLVLAKLEESADGVVTLLNQAIIQSNAIENYNKEYGLSYFRKAHATVQPSIDRMESSQAYLQNLIAMQNVLNFIANIPFADMMSSGEPAIREMLNSINYIHESNLINYKAIDDMQQVIMDGGIIIDKLQKKEPVPDDILGRLSSTISTMVTGIMLVGALVLFGPIIAKKVK